MNEIPAPPDAIDRADDTYESGWADGYARAAADARAQVAQAIAAKWPADRCGVSGSESQTWEG